MRNRIMAAWTLVMALVLAVAIGGDDRPGPDFTDDFHLAGCGGLVPKGSNLYFSLQPGHFLRYEGVDEDGKELELEITVLNQVQPILFEKDGVALLAMTRVVEEREWEDGKLIEVSRNFFARCARSNDIFYFGEEVDIYEDGRIVSHDGAWLAGVDDAEPGLIMPGLHLIGSRYFQEIAPDIAMDRAEHAEADLKIRVPAGEFEDCIKIVETSPLEPGHESIKYYAPGVGLIIDGDLELVEFRH